MVSISSDSLFRSFSETVTVDDQVFIMAGAELPNDALVDTGEVNTDNLIVNNSAFEAARLAVEDLRLNMDRPTGIPRDPCDINFLKGIRSAHKIDILKQCDDIEQHIIERGSKSALVALRSMLVSKLEAVTEAHIRYAAAEGLSFTAQQKAYSEFVGKLERKLGKLTFK